MLGRSVGLVMVAILLSGCAFSSKPLEPLVAGPQQTYFTLEWRTETRKGQRVIQGSIRNDWDFPAEGVRLLVEALEPPDRMVNQRLVTIGGVIMPDTRATFETSVPPAHAYRVRIFSYDWVQSAGR